MIAVAPARADQCAAALALLFAHHPAAQRVQSVRDVLDAQQRGEIRLDGLLLAEEDGNAVGAGLYIVQADNTAFVWPPVSTSGVDADRVIDALYAELSRRADDAGAWLSQCLVAVDELSERAALERNGFGHLADLSYMHRALAIKCPASTESSFHTTTFNDANAERFAAVVERTYIGSHDCPALSGARAAHEALVSHKIVGKFDPLRWKLYEIDNRDVGVMLINEHPEQNAFEVVYVGVVPEARGRGLCRAMLLDGIRAAQSAGGGTIFLAVDRRNMFAGNVYQNLGFREIDTKAVHVRVHPHRRERD